MKNKNSIYRYLSVFLSAALISVAFLGCNSGINSNDPPVVGSTLPENASSGASINGTITAIFNAPVDPATITDATFTVSSGGVAVSGAVTYDVPSKEATFAPSSNLDYSTSYTANLSTGVKNLEGIAMEADKEWTFTTAVAGLGPDPVFLGTSANYVILAKSAISTIPNSVITGDVGLSPAAESYMTGFSQTDATGYATSTQVTGFLYAADMVAPTSTNLTTAVSDMMTAYADAAGRITPDHLNFNAGEIGSQTLAPGLYKWTSSVTIGSDVTINGGANDIWIFQIEGNLNISTGFEVILSGGAQAKNIFWQISGQVTLGSLSQFEGIVMSQTAINMNTGSSINGRLLAQTFIALDHATVTKR
ncbi:MAG: ice-binding family protein [Sphaerochaeta sp.]